jgi:transcriptional regulator with XRE-family HTH domain
MPATPEERTAFGLALALARRETGMTQERLAVAIGKSQPLVGEWERGRKEPSPADACAAEQILNVQPPGSLTRHLGYLPKWAGGEPLPCTVTDAILSDPHLTDSRKRQLLGVYREFIG